MKLYNFFRSGTSHRLRIALRLKGLDVEQVPVDLRSEQHLGAESLEMLLDQLLLPAHAVGAADPRTDVADGLEITAGPLAVEIDRLTWSLDRQPIRCERQLDGLRAGKPPERIGLIRPVQSSRAWSVMVETVLAALVVVE